MTEDLDTLTALVELTDLALEEKILITKKTAGQGASLRSALPVTTQVAQGCKPRHLRLHNF